MSNQRKKAAFVSMRRQNMMFILSLRMSHKSYFSHFFTSLSRFFLTFATTSQPVFDYIVTVFRQNHEAILEISRRDLGYIAS